MILGYPTSDMVWGLKVQGSRSQGHKVQKHIEGDQVAGMSYALC